MTDEREAYRDKNISPEARSNVSPGVAGEHRAYRVEGVTGPYGKIDTELGASLVQRPEEYDEPVPMQPQHAPTLGYAQTPVPAETWTTQDVAPWEEAAPGRRELPRDIISDLNAAIASAAMCAYRCLYLSKWVVSINHGELRALFGKMAQAKWQHVGDLVARVVELGGTPVQSPEEWAMRAYGRYAAPPRDPRNVVRILEDSIRSEEAIVDYYDRLANRTFGRDHLTHMLAVMTLKQGLENLHALRAYL